MENANTGSDYTNAATTPEASFTTGLDNINRAINHHPLKTNNSQENENLWNNITHNFNQVYPPIDENARKKIAASRKDIEKVAIV